MAETLKQRLAPWIRLKRQRMAHPVNLEARTEYPHGRIIAGYCNIRRLEMPTLARYEDMANGTREDNSQVSVA